MTLPSRSQGSGYAPPKSRVQPRNAPAFARSSCAGNSVAVTDAHRGTGRAVVAVGDCPMCGKAPLEPVRLEGQFVCHGCVSSCIVCGDPCIPGDDACGACIRGLAPVSLAVPA